MTKINNMIEKVDINYLIYNSSILDKVNLKILRKIDNTKTQPIVAVISLVSLTACGTRAGKP